MSRKSNLNFTIGGLHSTEVAYLLFTQKSRARFMAYPIIYLMMLFRLIDGTVKNNGQRLDNVNQNYLVLATGKLELQKSFALGLILILPQLHIPYVSLGTNISLD